jgi:hypothetical protein
MFEKKPKNVETITAKLHDTVAELERHAEDQLLEADYQLVRRDAANLAHEVHKAEHALAKRVAGNIKTLLGS